MQPGDSEKSVISFFFETWLAGRRKLGSQHPDTMASIYSLAVLLKSIKKFKEAEELFREKLVASDSPSMLTMSFSSRRCCDSGNRGPLLFSELSADLVRDLPRHSILWRRSQKDRSFREEFGEISEGPPRLLPHTATVLDDS